jgi:hypothetical protein
MKEKLDIQRVINPVWQRLATNQKRTLRSGSVRAARSVWSESRSRVIESRNELHYWGLSYLRRGDSIGAFAMAMNESARSGSMSGAEMDWDVLGTCEDLRLLVEKSRTKVSRVKNTWEGWRIFPPTLYRTKEDRQGTAHQVRGEVFGTGIKSGRLSSLIVAVESRETPLGRSR